MEGSCRKISLLLIFFFIARTLRSSYKGTQKRWPDRIECILLGLGYSVYVLEIQEWSQEELKTEKSFIRFKLLQWTPALRLLLVQSHLFSYYSGCLVHILPLKWRSWSCDTWNHCNMPDGIQMQSMISLSWRCVLPASYRKWHAHPPCIVERKLRTRSTCTVQLQCRIASSLASAHPFL